MHSLAMRGISIMACYARNARMISRILRQTIPAAQTHAIPGAALARFPITHITKKGVIIRANVPTIFCHVMAGITMQDTPVQI